VEKLKEETKEFAREYKSYKSSYFSALDDDVSPTLNFIWF